MSYKIKKKMTILLDSLDHDLLLSTVMEFDMLRYAESVISFNLGKEEDRVLVLLPLCALQFNAAEVTYRKVLIIYLIYQTLDYLAYPFMCLESIYEPALKSLRSETMTIYLANAHIFNCCIEGLASEYVPFPNYCREKKIQSFK